MKTALSILFLLFFSTSICYSQTDWRKKLKEEVVQFENGKYTVDDTQEITFANGASINFQTTASGDRDIINRDNFIAIYNSVSIFLLVSILSEAGVSLDDVDFKELESPTKTPEIKVHMDMTENGLEMIISTEEGDEKQLMSWEEFFK